MQINLFSISVFVVLTAIIVTVSWRSLKNPRAHGFYRFFAWEFIAALLALNLQGWFADPFSWHQCISWVLLVVSLLPLGFGVYALKTKGKTSSERSGEPELLAFEKTSELITTGIYRYIRHPLYSSLLLLAWGTFFKSTAWFGLVLTLLVSIALFLTSKADEKECLRYFGSGYSIYMSQTKRFIPYIF